MQLACEDGDFAKALAEIDELLRPLVLEVKIEHLQKQIADRQSKHKGTAALQRDLVLAKARQLRLQVVA